MANIDKLYTPKALGDFIKWLPSEGIHFPAGGYTGRSQHKSGDIHFSWYFFENEVTVDAVASFALNGSSDITLQWAIYEPLKEDGEQYALPGEKVHGFGSYHKEASNPSKTLLGESDAFTLKPGFWFVGTRNNSTEILEDGRSILDGVAGLPQLAAGIDNLKQFMVAENQGTSGLMPDSFDIVEDIKFYGGSATSTALRLASGGGS